MSKSSKQYTSRVELRADLSGPGGAAAGRASLGEIAAWEPGSFIEIGPRASFITEIALSIDGELRATGRAVERDGRLGVEILGVEMLGVEMLGVEMLGVEITRVIDGKVDGSTQS